MEWLLQMLDGTPDAATIAHLRSGLNTWLKSGTRSRRDQDGKLQRTRPLSLARCLGLPENPEQVRARRRDAYLRLAGDLLRVDLAPTKSLATTLHKEVQRFDGHRWLCWAGMTAPPPNADDLDRLLFLAMQAGGGKLPTTARQYATILKS